MWNWKNEDYKTNHGKFIKKTIDNVLKFSNNKDNYNNKTTDIIVSTGWINFLIKRSNDNDYFNTKNLVKKLEEDNFNVIKQYDKHNNKNSRELKEL